MLSPPPALTPWGSEDRYVFMNRPRPNPQLLVSYRDPELMMLLSVSPANPEVPVVVEHAALQGASPTYLGNGCLLIAGIWLLISAWRMPESAETAPEGASPAMRDEAGLH